MKKIKEILYKNALKAAKIGEIPVSAVITFNGKIISKAYNLREKNNDVLGHAEIVAIKKASKRLKRWNLSDCEMYVTLEPCDMCKEIIKQSRIKKVYYFLGNDKKINSKVNFKKVDDELSDKMLKEMKKFFEKRR